MKTCQKCGIEKDIESFAKGIKYKNGRRGTCKECHAGIQRNYYYANPEKMKERSECRGNWKRHKLTEDEFNKLFNLYDGKCHACKINDATSIDHNHNCCDSQRSCGKCVRGILCHYCNTALGLLKDDRQKVIGLLQYIDN